MGLARNFIVELTDMNWSKGCQTLYIYRYLNLSLQQPFSSNPRAMGAIRILLVIYIQLSKYSAWFGAHGIHLQNEII